MYQEKRMGPRMPSRVNAIKWLGVLQLIHGILIFIVNVVLFAIDFEQNKTAGTFIEWTEWGFAVAFFAIGSGVVGASMSRYEGLIHNVSSKQTHLPLSVMNAFAAIVYMVVAGTWWFYTVDDHVPTLVNTALVPTGKLAAAGDNYKASFSMVIITFALCFFDMLVAFLSTALCALWVPNESGAAPTPYVSERYAEEPYVVREERVSNYPRSHTGAYGRGGYPYDYYNGGYRTLPALKY